jgi:predicted MFS family arabinose efflux permease
VGGVLGTTLSGRAAAGARPRAVLVGALLTVAGSGALLAVTPWLAGVLAWSVVGGAGAIVVEVLTETALQRDLAEDVLARAYGIAFPASIGGIVLGSLVAAPLVSVFGLTGALLSIGVLVAGYAAVVGTRASAPGRHRAPRITQPAPAAAMAG